MIVADQLVCHLVGDYVLQSDLMASEKTKRSLPCFLHVLSYTLPFLFLTFSWKALLFIAATHFVIDRWRLARHLAWIKNFMAPRWIKASVTTSEDLEKLVRNLPWETCKGTGYPPDKPVWLSVWLMIFTDNTCHLILNGIALKWL